MTGRLNNSSEDSGSDDLRAAESVLKTVTQDLKTLQQDLIAQLHQDIERLQTQKFSLLNEIEKLQEQQQTLLSQHQTSLSQRQLAQQQLWAKQLAQAMAAHLQASLIQRLNQSVRVQPLQNQADLPPDTSDNGNPNENAYRLLSSLDTTLNHTLTSLRQDLNSYQSSLSQQIGRMHSMEQQGEAILEALVNRLSQQLQKAAIRTQSGGRIAVEDSPRVTVPNAALNPPLPTREPATAIPVTPAIAPPPARAVQSQGLSQFQLGLILILLSTVALSLHNVVVGIIGNVSSIFGIFPLGGYIRLSLPNSLFILWLRMLIVVPLMMMLAKILYPPAWRDIKAFFLSRDRRLLRNVIGSGFFLFLSQVLIYVSIGQVGPGVAVTILFMYPLVTVPLAWLLFSDRPTTLRWVVMFAIFTGIFLTAIPRITAQVNAETNVPLGVTTAAISGIAFAFYLISMQISFRKLHPVPVSVIQFFTIFLLTSLSLMLPLGPKVLPHGQIGFIVGGIVLGTLTLIGYLLNNFGVRFMGAARASIVASSGPALTALLAFLITPGDRTALQGIQIFGILIVTLGVTALSFEKMLLHNRAVKMTK